MGKNNLINKTILGFTVTEELGEGAFGKVYKVEKTNVSGHYVRAMKHIAIPNEKQYESVLNSMGGNVAKANNYFEQMLGSIVSEIQILSQFSDNHIVRYYDNHIESTVSSKFAKRYDVYIMMEYLTPLDDYVKSKDFRVRDIIKLGLDVLRGLQVCHDKGVIHRDIKEDNIFVSDDGAYKIGDFGVSKALKDSSKAESMKGTPNFIAPEVYIGKESYTKSVDLYSLGIVLYRYLNYERNPFLPYFPESYGPTEEAKAFEERIAGKIPGLPSLGGEAIGKVLVKSISSRYERFQNANEFIQALETALRNTDSDILNQSIRYDSSSNTAQTTEPEATYDETVCEFTPESTPQNTNFGYVQTFADEEYYPSNERNGYSTYGSKSSNTIGHTPEYKAENYGETIGENIPSVISYYDDSYEDDSKEEKNARNKKIFETMGEAPKDPGVTKSAIYNGAEKKAEKKESSVVEEYKVATAPQNVELQETPAIDQNTMKKIAFILPFALVLVAIITLCVLIPNLYGKTISLIDWLFSGPQNIIDTLRDSGAVLPKVGSIILLKFAAGFWLVGFIASLILLSRVLHDKPVTVADNAILKDKEASEKMTDIYHSLQFLKQKNKSSEFQKIEKKARQLKEKLASETKFGRGNSSVIKCENDIANQMQYLVELIADIEKGNVERSLPGVQSALTNLDNLLAKRTELQKK